MPVVKDLELFTYHKDNYLDVDPCVGCGSLLRGASERVAILVHKAGQKYTIGPYFTSKAEQGELIICDFGGLSSCTRKGHCEIVANPDNFTINALEGGNVSLNGGRQLQPGHTKVLKVDDEIKLGDSDFPELLYVRNPVYGPKLCVVCKEMDVSGSGCASDLVPTGFPPGQISLILEKILDFLPLKDLKEARLVSQAWNEEGTKILKKKTEIRFNFKSDLAKSLFLYEHQAKQLQHPAWNIIWVPKDPFADSEANATKEGTIGAKLLSDLESFFLQDAGGSFIKHLKMKVAFVSSLDVLSFIKILKNTAPYLETFEIELHIDMLITGEMFDSELAAFPSLKSLAINAVVFYSDFGQNPERLSAWKRLFESFLKTPKNLEKVMIQVEDSEVLKICLENLGKSVKNLGFRARIGMRYHGWSDSQVRTPLLGIPPNQLTQLTIALTRDWEAEPDRDTLEFLWKHSNFLEKLELTLATPYDEDSTKVSLPPMPKLKSLEIKIVNTNQDVPADWITFPHCVGGVLVYSENFPSLRSLSFELPRSKQPDIWLQYKEVLAPFFYLDQVCVGVVDVKAPYFWKDAKGPHFTKGIDIQKLREMFPNPAAFSTFEEEAQAVLSLLGKGVAQTIKMLGDFEKISWGKWNLGKVGEALGQLAGIREAIQDLQEMEKA